jgi:chitin disaccharide deacetylase
LWSRAARAILESMSPPRVIITADDLGLREDWDRASLAAVSQGIVTAVSVVTNGVRYRSLLEPLRAAGVDHGVHLNLLTGEPLSPPERVRTLLGNGERLCQSSFRFLSRYLLGRVSVAEIRQEWLRQVQRAFDDGLRPSFLNAHYHLHALPALLRVIVELADQFGIRWVRLPDEPARLSRRWDRTVSTGALRMLSRAAAPALRNGRVRGIHCRGIADSGALSERVLRRLVGELDAGVTEIVCHPGQAEDETRALTSAEVAGWLARRARLCSFRDLEPERG